MATQTFCTECGSPIGDDLLCKCGARRPAQATDATLSGARWEQLSSYYQSEFNQILSTKENYKGKWNWAAFLFGPFWALTKGLWLPSLIAFVGGVFTGGAVAVAYWIVFAARGNYMYYAKEVKQKDIPI
jgi:hypothetical protein